MMGLTGFTAGVYDFEVRFIGKKEIYPICQSVSVVVPTPTPTPGPTSTPGGPTPTPTPTATPSNPCYCYPIVVTGTTIPGPEPGVIATLDYNDCYEYKRIRYDSFDYKNEYEYNNIPIKGIKPVNKSIKTLINFLYFDFEFFMIFIAKSFNILAISGFINNQNVVKNLLKMSFIILKTVFAMFFNRSFIFIATVVAAALNIFHKTTNGKNILGENTVAISAFGNINNALKSKFNIN
jgi:hypothetical protein